MTGEGFAPRNDRETLFRKSLLILTLAKMLRQPRTRYVPGTNIEIINPKIKFGKVRHLLFDNDGTISVIRQGWENIMGPLMVEKIIGGEKASAKKKTEIETYVNDYIDRTTGIQTIFQMEGLCSMIKKFGFIGPNKILSALDYKRDYHERLNKIISERLKKLKKGEIKPTDLMIKGTLDFLRSLKAKNVALYLASGSDRDDVVNELKILGLDKFFGKDIYGAIDSVRKETKKEVIERIIRENNLSGPELACIGDGPVELKLTKVNGGIAICLASDEIKKQGLNPIKRKRGIIFGQADLVIPDFSQGKALVRLLVG